MFEHLTAEEKSFYLHKKLTPAQLEKAALHRKDAYPQRMPCAVCAHPWMRHRGLLCPTQEGQIIPLRGGANSQFIVIPPVFDGTSLFVPDENYYKSPDFEVG